VFLVGVILIMILGLFYAVGLRLSSWTTDGKVAALDLDHEGSIASWFSVTLLTLCGLTTLVIRRMRRAAGCNAAESRAWLLMGLLWVVMSIDEGSSLHEAFKEALVRITSSRLMGDGSIYWAVPYFFLLSVAGLFLLFKVRRNLLLVACLAGAGSAFGIAAAGQLDLILSGKPYLETWIEESCEMFADLCILLCLMLYTRKLAEEMEAESVRSLPMPRPNTLEIAS
jgi:hypothetical protein